LEAADCKLKGAGKRKELKGDLTRKQKYQGNKPALLENNPSHYRKKDLYRVSNILPSVFSRALGKEALCRVPCLDTRQRSSLPSASFRHSAKIIFKSYFEVVN
jgi:hypothetical protein